MNEGFVAQMKTMKRGKEKEKDGKKDGRLQLTKYVAFSSLPFMKWAKRAHFRSLILPFLFLQYSHNP